MAKNTLNFLTQKTGILPQKHPKNLNDLKEDIYHGNIKKKCFGYLILYINQNVFFRAYHSIVLF